MASPVRRKKVSMARAGRTTVDGAVKAAESLVPGLSLIVAHTRALFEERHIRKLEDFLVFVLGNDPKDSEGVRFERSLAEAPFCLEAFKKVFEDEEAEKSWAYAGLFQAFAANAIVHGARLRHLRAIRELTAEDVGELVALGVRAEALEKRVAKFGMAIKEDERATWNSLESSRPSLVGTLVQWGFCIRRDGTRPPVPTKALGPLCSLLLEAHRRHLAITQGESR